MGTPFGRRLFASAAPMIAFVLWTPFLDQCLKVVGLTEGLRYIGWAQRIALQYHFDNYNNFKGFTWGYVLWLTGELAWWWIITLLLAVLGAFVSRTELWAQFCRLPRSFLPWVRVRFQACPQRRLRLAALVAYDLSVCML